jgi:Mrp family chromosome partitioning ATPase
MEKNEPKEIQRKENLERIKHRILIMSGKGGVGKSFIAVNLAYGLALQGKKVGILDIDIHGPSVVKLTNIEGVPVPIHEKSGLPTPIKALSNISVLSVASLLPSENDALIWRGPIKTALIRQFFTDFYWEELDYLIIDCPPGTGDEPLSIVQTLEKIDGVVLVSTPQNVAVLDVKKTVHFVQKLQLPILGIIENMKFFRCPKCHEVTTIFEGIQIQQLADTIKVEILAELEMDPAISISMDAGKPYIYFWNELPAAKALQNAVLKIMRLLEKQERKM